MYDLHRKHATLRHSTRHTAPQHTPHCATARATLRHSTRHTAPQRTPHCATAPHILTFVRNVHRNVRECGAHLQYVLLLLWRERLKYCVPVTAADGDELLDGAHGAGLHDAAPVTVPETGLLLPLLYYIQQSNSRHSVKAIIIIILYTTTILATVPKPLSLLYYILQPNNRHSVKAIIVIILYTTTK